MNPPRARSGRRPPPSRVVALASAIALGASAWAARPPAAATAPAAQGGYVHAATWPLPEAPGAPRDVAVLPGGALVAADADRGAVLSFDAAGRLAATWDHPPIARDPAFAFVPLSVAFDADRGMLYILWQRHDAEGAGFDASGLFLDTRGTDGAVRRQLLWLGGAIADARDMALRASTGDLYILATAGVQRVRMPGGTVDAALPLAAEDRAARSVAVTPDGRIVVPRGAGRALAAYDPALGLLGTTPVIGGEPLAVAAGADGRLHALVRADDPDDPRGPLVLSFPEAGGAPTVRSAAALQAPPVPEGAWPFAIDAALDDLAFVTADGRFRVHAQGPSGPRHAALVGAPARALWSPSPSAAPDDETLMIDRAADGAVWALDGRDERIVRFGPTGAAEVAQVAPEGAIDLALGAAGEAYVAARDDRLRRLGRRDLDPPAWEVACACDLGGRLALESDVLYVSRPRTRAVGIHDARTGVAVRADLHLDAGSGLWPSDLSAGDGALITADQVMAQLQTWTRADVPDAVWPAGLLAGPRRVASATSAEGERIVAAVMTDGWIAMHALDSGNLVGRWLPTLPDGATFHASDIAAGDDGLIYLADAAARAVRVFEPSAGGIPETPDPAPTPTPGPDACIVAGDKRAEPEQVAPGGETRIALSLRADCPNRSRVVGADIVLAIDRSGSMRGAPLAAARAAARAFAELLDVRYHRIGLASFADAASVDVPLTDDVAAVIDGLDSLAPGGGTNIAAALRRARENLDRFGRVDSLPVIVLLTDGRHTVGTDDPQVAADAARAAGTLIFAVGLGDDLDMPALARIAGDPARSFRAPTPSELFPIYRQILRTVLDSLAGNVVVTDVLAPGARLVDGSTSPPAVVQPGVLQWGRTVLPSTGITMSYRIRPDWRGCAAANVEASAEYTDGDGVRRRFDFPVPTVCVVPPTATPTASPTPTRAPTAAPEPLYLPLALDAACARTGEGADVVLLVDTSGSMAGEKLERAREAAADLLDLLDLERDQAAVFGFDDRVLPVARLTRDLGALRDGLAILDSGQGTRIDRALQAAVDELRGPRRDPANRGAVVLLSDGAQTGPTGSVLLAARELAELGAIAFAVGLGADADRDLLRAISGPERYFDAPSAADLAAIYRAIAGSIPCP